MNTLENFQATANKGLWILEQNCNTRTKFFSRDCLRIAVCESQHNVQIFKMAESVHAGPNLSSIFEDIWKCNEYLQSTDDPTVSEKFQVLSVGN